ncbi:MAG: hypothetical protein K6T59_16190 [Bryobacteraceae bacterium]|nr:hypothetical protein [Bryobacteraceae bacterium]
MRRGTGGRFALAARIGSQPLWARRLWIGAATLVALVAIIGTDYLPPALAIQVGQPSPRDLESPRTVEFVDQARTEALRAEAMRSVPPVLRHSPAQVAASLAATTAAFDAIETSRLASLEPLAGRMNAIRQAVGLPLSKTAAAAAAVSARQALAAARRAALAAVEQALGEGVRDDTLPMARERARNAVRSAGLSPELAALAAEVAVAVLRPTMEVDATRTAEVRSAA